ncbi:ATP-dependent RNA helicase HrpA, partial [Algiphilus sp.]|uniref:ATP-dependent RNA helicase HrpA n=1 Tax=Algiphilus sp. TaxID=1872431 RepID=UPI003C5B98CC
YPPELPVVGARDDLLRAIREQQVLVVCGDTGSGKSTQLPKLCLEAGRGRRGLIGHTQPRRLAARALAGRIAGELQTAPGDLIGFETRFEKQLGDDGLVKLMTDGILLAELGRDRDLAAYDTLIIDEAHERSLNIDFLLGYLRQLLPRRPDLKLIITSATLDPESLSRHFRDAPIMRVEGRSYPIRIDYAPPARDDDLPGAVADAMDRLWSRRPDGDALVFLPGEREIRECARVLRGRRRDAEVLPLYARLGARAQDAVFTRAQKPRIVLATNVAETSLTVPGIRYVVDTGTARVARFQPRSGVQSLKIEPVSRAAADQRAGRCGRVGPGHCLRLYAEDDLKARPAFTDPEIRRSNLAGVILQMASLKLGRVEDFPWLDAPETRHVREGERLLRELGALDDAGGLTRTGRELARLPLDPRMARIALAAKGTAAEDAALILAAALAVADPHEQPADQRDAARSAHGQWRHARSDFLTLLNLWDRTRAIRRDEGSSALRRWCEKHFVSFNRLREWGLVVAQLRQALGVRAADDRPLDDAGRARALKAPLHQALLAGLIDHIGMRLPEKGGYQGPRGRQFRVFPGSGLAKKAPPWLMCAELAQTRQLFARTCAAIEPAWLEQIAPHLLRRSLEHPAFDAERGEVSATEVVRFHGLELTRRARHYGSAEPQEARAIFIREALVRGALRNPPRFLRDNLALVAAVRDKEERLRRPDLLADDDQLCAFYDARLPAEVCTQSGLEKWLRRSGQSERVAPDRPMAQLKQQMATQGPLHMREPDVLRPGADADVEALFPDRLTIDGHRVALEYRHDPGADADGVTFVIDLPALFALPGSRFDWLVRGLRPALFEALLRSLPGKLRRRVTPAAHFADALTERLGPDDGALLPAVCAALADMCGAELHPEDFDRERL